jgi:LysM repeat protein
MNYVAIDCATKLTADLLNGLKKEGVTHVIRYINPGWKGQTKDEAQATSDAGIQIISVFETNPTKDAYFTREQGTKDAQNASQYAKDLGQAKGSAIYFAVDYDAQGKDLGAILDYFAGVVEGLDPSFKLGAYGSYAVLQYLNQHSKVEYFFQTYAWSHGQVCDFAHLYQYENGVKVAGITADRDKVLKDPAAWSLPKVVEIKHEIEAEVVVNTGILKKGEQGQAVKDMQTLLCKANFYPDKDAPNHGVDEVYGPKTEDAVKRFQEFYLPHEVDGIYGPHTKAKLLEVTSHVQTPKPDHVYHTVQKDESLSVIADNNGISLGQIEKLNPQIKHPDVIHPGDKVRVR